MRFKPKWIWYARYDILLGHDDGLFYGAGERLEASSLISPYPPAENMHIGSDLEPRNLVVDIGRWGGGDWED